MILNLLIVTDFFARFSTSTSCHFIAPQTRMRIVDNSQFSSIAPEQKRQVVKKGGVKQGAQEAPATPDRDEVKDVKAFLQIGISGISKRKPMVIRVYNQKNRGVIGESAVHWLTQLIDSQCQGTNSLFFQVTRFC